MNTEHSQPSSQFKFSDDDDGGRHLKSPKAFADRNCVEYTTYIRHPRNIVFATSSLSETTATTNNNNNISIISKYESVWHYAIQKYIISPSGIIFYAIQFTSIRIVVK